MGGIGVHLYSKDIGTQDIYGGISARGLGSNGAGANDSVGIDARLNNIAKNNTSILNQSASLDRTSALQGSKNGLKGSADAPYKVAPALGVAIEKVTSNTPAERANLQTDDVITAINGVSVQGEDAFKVAHDLQGSANTTVELSIVRNGEKVDVPIVREVYDNPDVSAPKDMGNGVTYIRVYSFGSNSTGAQLRDAMNKMPDSKSFIIDIRGNSGGYITSAIDSAELFVKKGTLMTKRERLDSDITQPIYQDTVYSVDDSNLLTSVKTRFNSAIKQDLIDNSIQDVPSDGTKPSQRFAYAVANRPVVLLVNGDSASAAEIFDGALHDSGDVTTLGTQSFGKGIGQSIFRNMPGGTALKLTSLQYKTPSGKCPGDGNGHRHGLDPDVPVENPPGVRFESDQDLQLQAAVKLARQKSGT
jgi:carboxyl-terminal processing protease